MYPLKAVQKLSSILRVATIDIECVGCKEVYPNFMDQLISRISGAVRARETRPAETHPVDLGLLPGDSTRHPWTRDLNMDLNTTKSKNKKPKQGEAGRTPGTRRFDSGGKKGGAWVRVHTPRTERFQYNMAKTNEIDLAVGRKSQRVSGRKEAFLTPRVKLNELSSGGKFVFGRSGSKWGRGEHFQDIVGLDFYHGSEGRGSSNRKPRPTRDAKKVEGFRTSSSRTTTASTCSRESRFPGGTPNPRRRPGGCSTVRLRRASLPCTPTTRGMRAMRRDPFFWRDLMRAASRRTCWFASPSRRAPSGRIRNTRNWRIS